MNYRPMLITLLILLLLNLSCASDKIPKDDNTENQTGSTNAGDEGSSASDEEYDIFFEPAVDLDPEGNSQDTDSNITNEMLYFTQDVLGKAYIEDLKFAITSLEDIESTTDISLMIFNGTNSGSFQFSTTGFAEDTLSSDGYTTMTVYDPLRVRLTFNNYQHTHPCLGTVTIHGEVECYIKGVLNNQFNEMLSKGTCVTGTFTKLGNVSYKYSTYEHRMSFVLGVDIDGDPYDLSNYLFSGKVTINGYQPELDALLTMQPKCKLSN
ncbi:hypothetical protein KKA47_06840 [bacterium]|nr:hypothetical protein [bacterium]